MKKWILLLSLAALQGLPAYAQTPAKTEATPAKPMDMRIEQLPSVLAGTLPYDMFFAPSFLAAVPVAQLKLVSDQFIAEHGKPLKIISVEPQGQNSATVKIEYEKAIATAQISVEPAAPHKVVGLLITGFDVKGDSPAKIDAAFAALPGKAGYLVEKIGTDGRRTQIAGRATGQQFAIASTF